MTVINSFCTILSCNIIFKWTYSLDNSQMPLELGISAGDSEVEAAGGSEIGAAGGSEIGVAGGSEIGAARGLEVEADSCNEKKTYCFKACISCARFLNS